MPSPNPRRPEQYDEAEVQETGEPYTSAATTVLASKKSGGQTTVVQKTAGHDGPASFRSVRRTTYLDREAAGIPWPWILLGALATALACLAGYGGLNLLSHRDAQGVRPEHRDIYYQNALGGPNARSDVRLFDLLRHSGAAPRFTLLEKLNGEAGWFLQMDVPGFVREEVTLYSTGPFLKVRGAHRCPTESDGSYEADTCVERSISEEIRFPDEADMDSAQASLEHGVLKVHVKPSPDYKPRGRVVQIFGQVSEAVHHMGESVREKLGEKLGLNRAPTAVPVNRGEPDEYPWTLTGTETEEVVRQHVEDYAYHLSRAFRIPAAKAHHFVDLVRAKTDVLVRKKSLSPSQLKLKIREVAEDAWESLSEEIGGIGEDIKSRAGYAYDRSTRAGRYAKDKLSHVSEDARDKSRYVADYAREKSHEAREATSSTAGHIKDSGQRVVSGVKGAVQDSVDTAKEKAREYQERLSYAGEKAGHRIAEAGERAKHRAAETYERAADTVQEGVHTARDRAREAAEYIADRAHEQAHYAAHVASENVERAEDRLQEGTHFVKNRAEEGLHRVQHRSQEGGHSSHRSGKDRQKASETYGKGFADTIKSKLGWGLGAVDAVRG